MCNPYFVNEKVPFIYGVILFSVVSGRMYLNAGPDQLEHCMPPNIRPGTDLMQIAVQN